MSDVSEIISRQEERLRLAQLAGDVEALDDLISDDLQFVFLDGGVYSKQMDLDAHRARIFRIHTLEFSEQVIRCFDDTAIVTVKARLSGTNSGQPVEGVYRYIRTWIFRDRRWQIIAGSVSQVGGHLG